MKPIWIVDDDPSIRFVLEKALGREGWPIRSFTQPRDVLKALADVDNSDPERQAPQVLVSDIRMPAARALSCWSRSGAAARTADDHHDGLFRSGQCRLGIPAWGLRVSAQAFDVPKAVELIRRAVEESQREEVADVQAPVQAEMLGQAPAMQDVFRAIGRLSQSHVTVLITGESGAGKELVARALHKHSPVAGGPFVAINTAAIPKDLLESELFGHERGAFTGAQTQRRGVSSRPKAVRCFSMKSATCRSSCRRVCCGCSPTVISTGLADIRPSRPMCA
jgi:two-component system nitrogen regulation response regulator GlnG